MALPKKKLMEKLPKIAHESLYLLEKKAFCTWRLSNENSNCDSSNKGIGFSL
tara:strand:- start:496 stop:651 length:156 start_codon:yes stop_codon:yes gene_type:complete